MKLALGLFPGNEDAAREILERSHDPLGIPSRIRAFISTTRCFISDVAACQAPLLAMIPFLFGALSLPAKYRFRFDGEDAPDQFVRDIRKGQVERAIPIGQAAVSV